MITPPLYWNGVHFPSQGGLPVKISNTEFQECCCGTVFDADFIVITYNFVAAGGIDLDTRTSITAPITRGPLGWCKSNDDAPLYWGDDNTGYGVESCYIDLTHADLVSQTYVEVLCQAWWYGTKQSGDMSLDIKAYLGGTISQVGYGFVNTGGTETANISSAYNVSLHSSACVITPDTVATVRYNMTSGILTFT